MVAMTMKMHLLGHTDLASLCFSSSRPERQSLPILTDYHNLSLPGKTSWSLSLLNHSSKSYLIVYSGNLQNWAQISIIFWRCEKSKCYFFSNVKLIFLFCTVYNYGVDSWHGVESFWRGDYSFLFFEIKF